MNALEAEVDASDDRRGERGPQHVHAEVVELSQRLSRCRTRKELGAQSISQLRHRSGHRDAVSGDITEQHDQSAD